jgi:putative hydrolase of the HAD superfamily
MNVVFDFGAVLFTWRPVEIVARAFPSRAATPADASQLAQAMFSHEDWHDYDRGLLEVDAVVDRLSSRLSLDRDAVNTLVQTIGECLRPMEETVAVLQSLQARRQAGEGVRGLYFLSNMPRPYARELEQKHAFLQHFDGGIFSGDVLLSKPNPAIYQMLQSRYQLKPESIVFIDDMHANVQAAQDLGWKCVHLTEPHTLAETLRLQFGL